MKTRILAGTFVVVMVVMVLLALGQQALAKAEPALAIDTVFTALSSGEVDAAMASFTNDAIVENRVRGDTYTGASEIRQMLQAAYKSGRQFKVVDVETAGDTIIAKIEISDRGIVWGTETIVALVKDGLIQTLEVAAFRLDLWRIGK
jgi:hypothetical protein